MGAMWKRQQANTAQERKNARRGKAKWSKEQNQKLVEAMDSSGDGNIDEAEFIKYCDQFMPEVGQGFNEIMTMWIDVGLRATENYMMRMSQLTKVFKAFDFDHSGYIEVAELLTVGQAVKPRPGVSSRKRRTVVSGVPEWSEAHNVRLVQVMDTSGDGRVSEAEFCFFCNKMLPQDETHFMLLLDHFLEVAREVLKAQEVQAKRAETDSEAGGGGLKQKELPKYGIATKLHDRHQNFRREKKMKHTLQGELEHRKQRTEDDYRSRGRMLRQRAFQVKQRAVNQARTWREHELAHLQSHPPPEPEANKSRD